MDILELITKKRDGKSFKKSEIKYIVDKLLDGDIPDYQIGALLMAIYLMGLTDEETEELTQQIKDSGTTLELKGIDRPIIDKHSTGGVGDKVSFLIGPVCASLGLAVPLSAGRTLGHTGGTIDKLESIPGVRTKLSSDEIERVLLECGFVIFSQSDEIAPVDGLLYSLRDATATVDSIPLIVSSILGKKLAVETDGIIFDVKFGSGSFIPEVARAKKLAQGLVDIANSCGRKANALLTSNNEPLGRFVGNSLEIYEVVKSLKGEIFKDNLWEVSLAVSSAMLFMGGIVKDIKRGKELIENSILSGKPLELLIKMVSTVGGDVSYLEQEEKLRERSKITTIKAHNEGFIVRIDSRIIGELVRNMGGGRMRTTDEIDPYVGVEFLKKCGDEVKVGDEIALVYHSDDFSIEKISSSFIKAIEISGDKFFPEKIVLSRYIGKNEWSSFD